jgi:glycosyltransferase involved in cell wall biosynthesis
MHGRAGDGEASSVPPQDQARLRVLHVVVQAGPTNSQWNEHCLPVADERDLTVCSLLPATVAPDARITRLEGDGSLRGALRVLRRALRQGGHDVVHVHAPASAALLLAAGVLERRRPSDVVFTLHNSWRNLRPRNRPLAAAAMATFPVTVACSSSAAQTIPRSVRRFARGGVRVVPNGVDVERIDRVLATRPPEATDETPGPTGLRIATVGRLIPIKDQATLLEAFARVAREHDRLEIVGEGALRGRLERQAADLGIADRTRFHGLLPRDEVYGLLGRCDVFASPSHGEGLPLSVLEAMAVGLPVVLSDIGPHRELVAGTVGATLAPVDDVAALAGSLTTLQALTAAQRAQRGASCRQAVVGQFSLGAMARGYAAIYSGMATRRATAHREVA